jgi:2-methylcitrate dehydratase PrpD
LEITRRIAEYLATTDLENFSPEAVYAAKGAMMDCLGCMLAGSREPLADILCEFVRANDGRSVATIVGRGVKTSAPDAALVNGAMGHALDYDDITPGIKGHPTVVLLPAALALAEENQATGRDLLLAYMLGFEVACGVGDAMSAAYYDDLGWHPTGPLGVLAAAAAASRILKLNQQQTTMAISLAASQAAGLRQNFGTMTKPFHAGAACRAGVTAAKLARVGFTASQDAIEGRFGFLRAFSGGMGYNQEQVLRTLGKQCYLLESGIEIKKYPCCGSAHLALDAISRMVEREKIEPTQVERIEVKVDFDPPRSLIHYWPQTALEGKFSMQYCLAAALLDGRVGLGTFTDQQVLRPEAQSLIPKVEMHRIPGYEGQPSWVEGYNQVEVYLEDGRVLRERAERSTSGALRGVTMQDIQAKFRDCASLVVPDDVTGELVGLLDRLEELESISRLTDLLRGDEGVP